MKPFLRYLPPISYFQATRLNRLSLVAYNGLVEWIPAIAISLYLNDSKIGTLFTVLVSYLAFISLYEIGYITNDQLSEKFEEDPRGRSSELGMSVTTVIGLIVVRAIVFGLCSYVLGVALHPLWIAFHGGLIATFLLHNVVEREMRIATFFSLSTFRFIAPVLLTVPPAVLLMLLPIVMLNNSLYRLTVYVDNKKLSKRSSLNSKFLFYLACLPMGVVFCVLSGSVLPLAVSFYFILVWSLYWVISRAVGVDLRG